MKICTRMISLLFHNLTVQLFWCHHDMAATLAHVIDALMSRRATSIISIFVSASSYYCHHHLHLVSINCAVATISTVAFTLPPLPCPSLPSPLHSQPSTPRFYLYHHLTAALTPPQTIRVAMRMEV